MFSSLFYKLPPRKECQCCHYQTLADKAVIQQCPLCKWNDDGQGDEDAMKVRETVNQDYSLFEVRLNWGRTGMIYRSVDERFAEDQIKRKERKYLIAAYEALAKAKSKPKQKTCFEKILLLEKKCRH